MGEFADGCLDDVIDTELSYQNYMDGTLTHEQAYDAGLIDEHGNAPNELVNSRLSTGVMDQESLINELALCDGALSGSSECISLLMGLRGRKPKLPNSNKSVIHYWASGDKLWLPKDMTTLHLENAIRYAKRDPVTASRPIVTAMEDELAKRRTADKD